MEVILCILSVLGGLTVISFAFYYIGKISKSLTKSFIAAICSILFVGGLIQVFLKNTAMAESKIETSASIQTNLNTPVSTESNNNKLSDKINDIVTKGQFNCHLNNGDEIIISFQTGDINKHSGMLLFTNTEDNGSAHYEIDGDIINIKCGGMLSKNMFIREGASPHDNIIMEYNEEQGTINSDYGVFHRI